MRSPIALAWRRDFFNIPTSPTTIFTNTAVTAGFLHFNNTSEYQLTGLGSLTLQAAGTSSAQVEVDQGTDELNLPVTIASSPTTFNVAPGATSSRRQPDHDQHLGKNVEPDGRRGR